MRTTTYSVPAISCLHCKHAIEAEVDKVAGVTLVEVDIAARSVRVEGDASDAAVRAAMKDAGYDVAGEARASCGSPRR